MSDTTKPAKRPYNAPKLVTYGNITTLTQSNFLLGSKNDGGGKLKTKSRR
jgi:hypothetical protein